jgi:hypothetical protein
MYGKKAEIVIFNKKHPISLMKKLVVSYLRGLGVNVIFLGGLTLVRP